MEMIILSIGRPEVHLGLELMQVLFLAYIARMAYLYVKFTTPRALLRWRWGRK